MVEISSHPSSVPFRGIMQNGLGSGRDYIVEVAVDPVELKLSQLRGDAQRHRARQRQMIRVTAHEGDGATVWIREHTVTGQQNSSATSSCSPVHHRAALEVSPGLVQRQTFGDGLAAGPVFDDRI